MFQIFLAGCTIGWIAGIMVTYSFFESKYIKVLNELEKPVVHTLTIEIEEETK